MSDDKSKSPQDRITTDARPRLGQDSSIPARREGPATSPAAKPKLKKAAPDTVNDNWREIIETLVFVAVLVLLLKSFTAEAFVIPTGSMAETLYGYQKWVTCPQCDFEFPVNCSSEVEENVRVTGCVCPNCRYSMAFSYADSGKLADIRGEEEFAIEIDPKKEPLNFWADKQTTITLDGREVQLDKIREANQVRTIYQVKDGRFQARWVDAITKGSFPEREKLFNPSCNSGDRVLVAKYLSDTHLLKLERFDVVVFKFPEEPQHNYDPRNYIKRLIGLPGETIGIYHGDLYVGHGIKYPDQPLEEEVDLPLRRQMHKNYEPAKSLLEKPPPLKKGERKEPFFEILSKPPSKVLAMRRIVYDNNHPARDLVEKNFPPRWAAEKGGPDSAAEDYLKKRERAASDRAWIADNSNGFEHLARNSSEIDWLRYRHLLRASNTVAGSPEPERITDFIGYNQQQEQNWVGDLILEFKVEIKENEGDLILELSKGEDRFQARWQLSTGVCTLVRHGKDGKDVELAKKETSLKKPGTHKLRFANVDERLIVWVDGSLPFEEGVAYDPPEEKQIDGTIKILRDFYEPNDLEPAGIGVRAGGVQVSDLVLWRDTYYTNQDGIKTLYVQPGHYLCLGDNSPQSSDSRSWTPQRSFSDPKGGLVPEELMLGRALLVYWPLRRAGTIR
jgi:signal peptidase I